MYVPDVVVYHGNCDDGWAAALVVQRYLKNNDIDDADKVEFLPGNYDNKDDNYWLDAVRGKNVLVVDFSFKGPLRKKLETACKSMLLLDHRASARTEYGDEVQNFITYLQKKSPPYDIAEKELEENKIVMIMDDDRCGSSMCWAFFFPEIKRMPRVLTYIEDQDLGRRKLPDAHAFTYWLRGKESRKDHKNIDFITSLDESGAFNSAIQQGKIIYTFIATQLTNAAKSAPKGIANIDDEEGGSTPIQIAISLCPYEFASELANIMVVECKVDAALVFYHLPNNKVGVSIRGRKEGKGNTTFARRIATALGGGGHDMAAGASFDSYAEFADLISGITEFWNE